MKNGETPRFTVLTGDDTIGREKAREELTRRLREQHGEILVERYDSSREPFEAYTERMLTPSLFQEVRLFSIRHVNELNARDLKRLGGMFTADLPDAYCLVEIDEQVKRKDSLARIAKALDIKALEKKNPGVYSYLTFAKPPEYKIPEWLANQAAVLLNRTISVSNAAYLVDCVGPDLDALYSELQKIDIHLPANAPIDKQAITAITGATRAMSVYELARALGAKDGSRALEIIDSLFASTFYAPTALAAIFRHFWALLRIRAWAQANPVDIKLYIGKKAPYAKQNEIAHAIGVAAGLLAQGDTVKKAYPVVVLSGVVEQARAYSNAQLERILEWLRDMDVGVKTGRVNANRHAIEMLCYRILRIGELQREGAA
jgi:DNA polymerase III delta subunit